MVIKDIGHWMEELHQSGKLVIVEGPKDRKALQHYGISNIAVLSKQALYATAERIATQHSSVVILTDFDRKGKALYGALKKQFQRLGVKVDTLFREYLQKETDLSHIEGLHTYIKHEQQRERHGANRRKAKVMVR